MTDNDCETIIRLTRIESQLEKLTILTERIADAEEEISRLKLRFAYGMGFAGALAVVWTVVTTLYHLVTPGG